MKKRKDEWLTAGEVLAQYGFSRQALYHMRKAGKIMAIKKGGVYLYPRSGIEAYFLGRDEGKSKVPRP